MQKEVLTREKIKDDYKKVFHYDLLYTVKFIGVLTVILIVALYFFSLLLPPIVLILIVLPFYLLRFGIYLAVPFESYKNFRLIRQNKFRVVTDRLVTRERKTEIIRSLNTIVQYKSLIFESFGEYIMTDGGLKIHINQFEKKSDEIYDSAFGGDEFFLILYKNKILLAYNANYFKLEE